MICLAAAVSADEIERLARDPDGVSDLFHFDGRPGTLDLHKAWDGLRYLLTGGNSDPPLGLAILGGEPIGEDGGYGPPLYLTADRVAVVAEHLVDVTRESLSARYDPEAMDVAGLYPNVWARDGAGSLDWLLVYFDRLKAFYLDAAAGRCVVMELN